MPTIKVEPDLVTENRFTHVDGIGSLPSCSRSAEQSPDRYQSHRDTEQHPRANVRSSLTSRQTSYRAGIHSNDPAQDIPPNRHYTRSSDASPRGSATSQSASNLFHKEFGARLTGRNRPGYEPFAYTTAEYASRPNNFHQVSKVKKEEEDGSPSPLFHQDTHKGVYEDNRRRSPSKAMNDLSITSPTRSMTSSRGLVERVTRVGTDSDSVSSTPPVTPSARPVHLPRRTPPRPRARCECPINLLCPGKENHLIDCRPLVPESERNWRKVSHDLEAEGNPWDDNEDEDEDEDEVFIDLDELSKITQLLHDVETRPRSTARVASVRLWVHICQRQSVKEGDLAASGVIQTLEAFLTTANANASKNLPKDLREDMTALLRKWQFGDYSALPYRGLRRAGAKTNLDPEYQFTRKADFFGHGHLVNGMRWPNRLAMLRDGAHGMAQAGIHGSIKHGAYAVVMGLHFKPGTYADVDYGKTAYYIGTALSKTPGSEPSNFIDTNEQQSQWAELEPTAHTRALMKSQETGQPVRMFRSYKASKIVPGRPKEGYRYDGLYKVVDYECLKAQQQIYRFKMERLPEDDDGQGPLRGWEHQTLDRRERQKQQQREKGRGRNFGNTRSRSSSRSRSPNRRLSDERNFRQRTGY